MCNLHPAGFAGRSIIFEKGNGMNGKQFVKGSRVVYGTNGICLVEDIRPVSFDYDSKEKMYYILKPLSSPSSTIFVPLENKALGSRLREIMTREEIDSLILDMGDKEIKWDKDRRVRNEIFHKILSGGVREELLLMIRCINDKKQELTSEGKHLPATDSNTLKTAERLVEEEFSYVLDIIPENVGAYIRGVLDSTDKKKRVV